MIGVGDLVVCVDDVPQHGDHLRHPGLVKGRVFTVSGVYDASGYGDRCPTGFTLVEIQPLGGRLGFCADRFRKIQHDKREACEDEFVTLLNRTKVDGMIPAFQAWSDDLDRLMLDHGDYCRRLGDAADRAARALAVPVEPASRLDGFATSIAIAGDLG